MLLLGGKVEKALGMRRTRLNGPRADSSIPDTEHLSQWAQGLGHADESSFTTEVHWGLHQVDITTNTSHPDQTAVEVHLGIRVSEPVVDGNLGQPDGRHGVDGESLVHARVAVGLILREWRDPRRMPEGA